MFNVNTVALVIIAILVGMFHPNFHFKVEWGKGGKVDVCLPIFIVTTVTILLGGSVGTAFLAELAGWFLAGFLSSRNRK